MADSWPDTRFRGKLEGMGHRSSVPAVDKPSRGIGRTEHANGGQVMHLTQTIIGGVAVMGALQFAVLEPIKTAMLPEPPPMVINSLSYSDGIVTQDRTVNGNDGLHLGWEAFVISAATGAVVPGCEGTGGWEYSPGNRVVKMPLAEWVGNAACVLKEGSKYQLVARYKGLSWSTDARSEVFTK